MHLTLGKIEYINFTLFKKLRTKHPKKKPMNLFNVYPLFDIEIAKGRGCRTYDNQGIEYLDLYGGHAVISIGHSHPYYAVSYTHLTLPTNREV